MKASLESAAIVGGIESRTAVLDRRFEYRLNDVQHAIGLVRPNRVSRSPGVDLSGKACFIGINVPDARQNALVKQYGLHRPSGSTERGPKGCRGQAARFGTEAVRKMCVASRTVWIAGHTSKSARVPKSQFVIVVELKDQVRMSFNRALRGL
jgi:hypothetical protein